MNLICSIFIMCGHFFYGSFLIPEAIFVTHCHFAVENEFSAHLMTRLLTIFGHSMVMPTEQGYEPRTLLRLANQNAGNLITEEQFLIMQGHLPYAKDRLADIEYIMTIFGQYHGELNNDINNVNNSAFNGCMLASKNRSARSTCVAY